MPPYDLPGLGINQLKAISPSRFTALTACRLKEILTAGRQPALLPSSLHAHLGNVIHRFLEKARQGEIQETEKDKTFDALAEEENQKISASWLERHLAPLEENLPDYETRRQLCLSRQWPYVEVRQTDGHGRLTLGPEVVVFDGDSKNQSDVVGQIDLVAPDGAGYKIVDEKTGKVLDETGQIKAEYQIQLKLYAALCAYRWGQWPNRLIIRDLLEDEHDIAFSHKECEDLLADAKKMRRSTNEQISTLASPAYLANPAPDTCKFCAYRPACSAYWNSRTEDEEWPHDVRGQLLETPFKQGNGNLRLKLAWNGKETIICNLARTPDVDILVKGAGLAIYSLRPEMTHDYPRLPRLDRYECGPMTTVYLDPAGGTDAAA